MSDLVLGTRSAPGTGPASTSMSRRGKSSGDEHPGISGRQFCRRFILLIVIAWLVPPILGLSFLVWIGMFTLEQVRAIALSPIESVWIVLNLVVPVWYFRRYSRVIRAHLERPGSGREQAVARAIQRFPAAFWAVFLGFLLLSPSTVMVSAEWFAGFEAQPLDWLRIHLVAVIVSIVVGLPIFYLVFDLFGLAIGEVRIDRAVLTIRTKVALIGSLVPLLIDTLLVQYYWTRTGFFTMETFGVWLALEVAAIGGTLVFVRSFGQSLRPLEEYVLTKTADHAHTPAALVPRSTDELGVLTHRVRSLLERQEILEEHLVHSQKLEAVGHLAGGMAHDFNNILTSIIGFSGLVRDQTPETDPRRENLDLILEAADRATNLTRGLLTFSRKQAICPVPVDLNEVIASLESLLKRLVGEDVEMDFDLCDGRLITMADRGQFELVLMNLCSNARDAMPEGGQLRIGTARDRDADLTNTQSAPGAVVTLSDTGEGMSRETGARLFEPFFTTKGVGEGTGLGLSMVHGIVTQHGGSISVASAPGEGATFSIVLPLTEAEALDRRSGSGARPRGGAETVLMAEDNESIRRLLGTCLENAGYSVITARNGEEAVARFVENKDSVDIVVLDVMMPRMNGRQAYEAIRIHQPDVKVLLMSGYTGDVLLRRGITNLEVPLLRKPVSPNDFLKAVRGALD